MADTCNALQRYDQALECLEKLLVKDPDNCVLRTLAGDACVYLGDFEKAAPHYEQAIAAYTDKAEKDGITKHTLYSAYGNTLKTLNRFAEAAEAYGQSLQLEENKELYFQKGFCLLQTEKYSEAIRDFTKCIELGYEKATACFQRALCYYATANYSKAIADFKIYEKAFPKKTDSYLYMGLCHQNLKEYDSAISYYKKCIDKNISAGISHFNIANCYYNLEENSDAVKHYTEAINADSYLYESLLNRGVCYIRLNKYNEAKADLKRVIDECKDKSLVESATKSYDPIKNITIITKG
jgi:tetratricopeptide (TPR) repeat protein